MNQHETMLLIGFHHFLSSRFWPLSLNGLQSESKLPSDRRLPHSLYLGGWNRLAREYKGFYPRSFSYQFTLTCAVTGLIIAVGIVGLRVWEYATAR